MNSTPAPRAMDGFPPAEASLVHSGNWNELPWLRWTHLNRNRMLPAADIWRGDGPVWDLPKDIQDLTSTRFTLAGHAAPIALEPALDSLDNNGFLVLHRGRIVFERYANGMRAQDRHMLASVSKTMTGLLAGILAALGVVDLAQPVQFYVPALKGSPIGDATLRQLMDMQAGIQRPAMAHRGAGIGSQDGGLYEALGLLPQTDGTPASLYDMVAAREAAATHGARMYYDNAQTEAVGWALRRATGRTGAELLSEHLWVPLGAERDAFIVVDRLAGECFSGGMAMTLRDLARVGELLRRGGMRDGRQIIPDSFLQDLEAGGDRSLFAPTEFGRWMPGGSYRSFCYMGHDGPPGQRGSLVAVGRFGQRLWVAPQSEVVIAMLSSIPGPPPSPTNQPIGQLCRQIAELFAPA